MLFRSDYHDFDKTVERIKEYRKEAKQNHIHARKHYHDYMMKYVSNLYSDKIESDDVKVRETKSKSSEKFIKTKFNNVGDYGNAFLRYLTGTGLVVVNKKLQVVVAPNREDDVEYILNNVSREAKKYSNTEYNKLLFDVNYPKLLSDSPRELIKKINQLDARLSEYKDVANRSYEGISSLELKKLQYEKEEIGRAHV